MFFIVFFLQFFTKLSLFCFTLKENSSSVVLRRIGVFAFKQIVVVELSGNGLALEIPSAEILIKNCRFCN